MVSSTRSKSRLTIVARPNQSASWRSNLLLLLCVAIPSLAIALTFALKGAWPVVPFFGIELLALGAALHTVNCKLQYRHVITFYDDNVCIDKGFQSPQHSWQFSRDNTGLTIEPQKHAWEGPALAVYDRHYHVPLGEFLSREDSLKLAALLQKEIRVRCTSPQIDHAF
jgi:uncharacterized membrane protein